MDQDVESNRTLGSGVDCILSRVRSYVRLISLVLIGNVLRSRSSLLPIRIHVPVVVAWWAASYK